MASVDTSSAGSAFITEVDSQQKLRPHIYQDVDLMDQCRKDYSKIKEVVKTFSLKVETLIDKQRHEYVQAYENHMSDVQKELHQLREKVAEIANDETKNENISRLKKEQSTYKSEALRLLGESDDCRKSIRSLVRQTYALEKTRDWMLEKLRHAKKEYTFLIKERTRMFEDLGDDLQSQGSFGGSSSYTIELEKRPGKSINKGRGKGRGRAGQLSPLHPGPDDWDNKLAILSVSRGVSASQPQPMPQLIGEQGDPGMVSGRSAANVLTAGDRNKPYPDPFSLIAEQIALPVAASEIGCGAAILGGARGPPPGLHSKSQLVSARARRAELREFLSFCATSLHRPPWCRVQKRSYGQLLRDCQQKLKEVPPRHFSSNKHVLQLACELAAHPQTYAAILHVIEFGVAGVSAAGALGSLQGRSTSREESDEEEERDGGAAEEIAGDDGAGAGAGEGAADLDYPFFELGSAKMNVDTSLGLYADLESSLLRPPTTPKQVHELQAFKEKINSILLQSSSPKRDHSPSSSRGRPAAAGDFDSQQQQQQFDDAPLLDEDLRNYLEQEKNNRVLKKMGYFNQEHFLKFK